MDSTHSVKECASTELMCEYDEQRDVMIHRFDTGNCKCRCGKKIVRKPVKKVRLKFGKANGDFDFS